MGKIDVVVFAVLCLPVVVALTLSLIKIVRGLRELAEITERKRVLRLRLAETDAEIARLEKEIAEIEGEEHNLP